MVMSKDHGVLGYEADKRRCPGSGRRLRAWSGRRSRPRPRLRYRRLRRVASTSFTLEMDIRASSIPRVTLLDYRQRRCVTRVRNLIVELGQIRCRLDGQPWAAVDLLFFRSAGTRHGPGELVAASGESQCLGRGRSADYRVSIAVGRICDRGAVAE